MKNIFGKRKRGKRNADTGHRNATGGAGGVFLSVFLHSAKIPHKHETPVFIGRNYARYAVFYISQ